MTPMIEEYEEQSWKVANSLRAEINSEKLEFATALSELIDNSFDARADHVVISLQPKKLTVWDNGIGTPSPKLMCYYAHSDKPQSRRSGHVIGKYGVGFKHASFLFCKDIGTTQVTSMHAGVVRQSSVNWGKCIANDKLLIMRDSVLDATEAKLQLNMMHGTLIEFECYRPAFGGTETQLDAHIKKLEERYAPGLRRGRRIEVHYKNKPKRVLVAPKDPALLKPIEVELKVGNKTALLKAGLLHDPSCGKRGIHIAYDFRVINENCTDIVPPEYVTTGWWARVELDHKWDLSTNKMEVKDEDYAMLRDAVWQAVQPIAEEAKSTVIEYHVAAQLENLAQRLNAALGIVGQAKRPNRNGEKRERAERHSLRVVREAAVVDGSGAVKKRNGQKPMGSAFTVEYTPDERPVLSWAEGNRIYMNTRYDIINRAKGDGSQFANDLLFSIMMHAVSYSEARRDLFSASKVPEAFAAAFANGYSVQAVSKANTGT